jgi:hypothetical protein
MPQRPAVAAENEAGDETATFGYPRVRVFEQRVKDLWLSATGAVLNGG